MDKKVRKKRVTIWMSDGVSTGSAKTSATEMLEITSTRASRLQRERVSIMEGSPFK